MSARLDDTKSYLDSVRRERAARVDLFTDPAPAFQHPRSLTPAERDAALEVIRTCAAGQASLTVADIAPRLGALPERRAVGALMLAAARRGWIVAGSWEQGDASRHGRPVRRWVSRIYAESAP